MRTEVDSVEIPGEFVELAEQWHSGQADILYAVSSTGGLTLGNRRPYDPALGRGMTREEWYLFLWDDLVSSLGYCIRQSQRNHDEDIGRLTEFFNWASAVADRLRAEYGLE